MKVFSISRHKIQTRTSNSSDHSVPVKCIKAFPYTYRSSKSRGKNAFPKGFSALVVMETPASLASSLPPTALAWEASSSTLMLIPGQVPPQVHLKLDLQVQIKAT